MEDEEAQLRNLMSRIASLESEKATLEELVAAAESGEELAHVRATAQKLQERARTLRARLAKARAEGKQVSFASIMRDSLRRLFG